jgi:hypothetical protein
MTGPLQKRLLHVVRSRASTVKPSIFLAPPIPPSRLPLVLFLCHLLTSQFLLNIFSRRLATLPTVYSPLSWQSLTECVALYDTCKARRISKQTVLWFNLITVTYNHYTLHTPEVDGYGKRGCIGVEREKGRKFHYIF